MPQARTEAGEDGRNHPSPGFDFDDLRPSTKIAVGSYFRHLHSDRDRKIEAEDRLVAVDLAELVTKIFELPFQGLVDDGLLNPLLVCPRFDCLAKLTQRHAGVGIVKATIPDKSHERDRVSLELLESGTARLGPSRDLHVQWWLCSIPCYHAPRTLDCSLGGGMEGLLSILANIVTILEGLAKLLRKKQRINSLQATEQKASIEECVELPREISHATEVSQRLGHLIDLMRQCYPDLTLAELAEFLGYDDVGVLERLLSADSPPKLSVLEDVAGKIGASSFWLKTGKYTPFSGHEASEHDPRDYIRHIRAEKPRSVYLIRSDCDTGYVLIVFRFGKYRYKIFDTILHVSGEVGNTGRRQLFEFYEFVRIVRDKYRYGQDLGVNVYGRTLSSEKFQALSQGICFPGFIIERQSFNCSWWDDLTDIDYVYPIARDRYAGYGQPFMDAQSIIRDHRKYWGDAAE